MSNENINDLINKAIEMEDQSVVTEGGDFEYTPPEAGPTVGRFIEYIELGKHVEYYEGKPKAPARMVRVTFELTHPKNIKEVEIDGNTKKIADRMSINLTIKTTEKAKFHKLFNAMTYGRDSIKHMAQMLGEAFILTITHGKSADGKKTYANLYKDGVWGISAPRAGGDVILNTPAVDISDKIPAALSPIRVFLWGNPTKPCWDSLFIDGERDVKQADGSIKKESKNWLQERILSATDYGGSALEQMVAGMDSLPTSGTGTKNEEQPKTEVKTAASLPEEPKQETKADTVDNSLAALGL